MSTKETLPDRAHNSISMCSRLADSFLSSWVCNVISGDAYAAGRFLKTTVQYHCRLNRLLAIQNAAHRLVYDYDPKLEAEYKDIDTNSASPVIAADIAAWHRAQAKIDLDDVHVSRILSLGDTDVESLALYRTHRASFESFRNTLLGDTQHTEQPCRCTSPAFSFDRFRSVASCVNCATSWPVHHSSESAKRIVHTENIPAWAKTVMAGNKPTEPFVALPRPPNHVGYPTINGGTWPLPGIR